MFVPERTPEATDTLTEPQRRTTSAENAARIREAVDRLDVRPIVARVGAPTLVIHARNDGVQPLDQGRKLAAGIPGAEFVMLESSNHVILEHEPAWDTMFDAFADFIRIE